MSDLAWLVQRVSGSRAQPPAQSKAKPSQPAQQDRTTYVATRRKAKPSTPST